MSGTGLCHPSNIDDGIGVPQSVCANAPVGFPSPKMVAARPFLFVLQTVVNLGDGRFGESLVYRSRVTIFPAGARRTPRRFRQTRSSPSSGCTTTRTAPGFPVPPRTPSPPADSCAGTVHYAPVPYSIRMNWPTPDRNLLPLRVWWSIGPEESFLLHRSPPPLSSTDVWERILSQLRVCFPHPGPRVIHSAALGSRCAGARSPAVAPYIVSMRCCKNSIGSAPATVRHGDSITFTFVALRLSRSIPLTSGYAPPSGHPFHSCLQSSSSCSASRWSSGNTARLA